MTKQQVQVRHFHEAFQLLVNHRPTPISMREHALRVELIREELKEFTDAHDLKSVADALGDLLYVVLGSAVAYGIDLEPVFEAIHESNMSKMWTDDETLSKIPDGSYLAHSIQRPMGERRHVVKRADGKVIKSPSYRPAKIEV